MSILCIAEHNNDQLNGAVASLVTAASALGEDIHLLVAGHNCQSVAQQASRLIGVAQVLLNDHSAYEHQLAENTALMIAEKSTDYTHIIALASTTGKNLMPRLAALVDQEPVFDVTSIIDPCTFVRPIYAGNAMATVQSSAQIQILTIRPSAFEPAPFGADEKPIVALDTVHENLHTQFIDRHLSESTRPDLTAADIVVSGGRGLGSAENFQQIETLADKLGAAVGASRAAVDAGFAANDLQVGQTGKIVAPQLYIAVGISGAIQHLAGMKDSKVIVAINKDAEAPIMQVADYALVADLFDALPELEQKL